MTTMAKEVPALVKRARQGDQNAMAIIAQVRTQAERGVPKAKHAFVLIRDYIAAHPVAGASPTHEPEVPSNTGIQSASPAPLLPRGIYSQLKSVDDDRQLVKLFAKMCHFANGPKVAVQYLVQRENLSTERINQIASLFANPDHFKCVEFGYKNPWHEGAPMLMAKKQPDCFYALAVGMLLGRAKDEQGDGADPETDDGDDEDDDS